LAFGWDTRMAGGVRRFHQTVRSDPPEMRDFLSNLVQGRPLPSTDAAAVRLWIGLSVYSTEEQARRKAREYPWLGRFLAVLAIPEQGPILYARTLPASCGHHTLWGEPAAIMRCVVRVVPV